MHVVYILTITVLFTSDPNKQEKKTLIEITHEFAPAEVLFQPRLSSEQTRGSDITGIYDCASKPLCTTLYLFIQRAKINAKGNMMYKGDVKTIG